MNIDTRIKFRHLLCFLEIARQRSFAKAADALAVSQPAISKTLKELEEILEASLFERGKSGVSLTAAGVFAVALWITEHRLSSLAGSVRSMLTLAVVFSASSLLGASGLIPGGLSLPSASVGWIALDCLVLLYGAAFSALFICMPRLNIARNAPVMNMEPVAGMVLGWLILGQVLGALQVVGGLVVVSGIVALAYRR